MFNDCHTLAQLVEVLRYKLEGRGFDSAWCYWSFLLTQCCRPHCGSGTDSASNRNEHQKYFFWKVKTAGVDSIEIWEPQPPGTLWAWIGLYRYCLALPCWGTRDRLAGVKTGLRAGRSRARILAGTKILSSPHRSDRLRVPPRLPVQWVTLFFPGGKGGRRVELKTHLHLVSRLTMNDAILLLPIGVIMERTGTTFSFCTMLQKLSQMWYL